MKAVIVNIVEISVRLAACLNFESLAIILQRFLLINEAEEI